MQFWVYNICIYRYIYSVFRNPDLVGDILKYILYIWYKIYTLCGYIIIYSYRVYIVKPSNICNSEYISGIRRTNIYPYRVYIKDIYPRQILSICPGPQALHIHFPELLVSQQHQVLRLCSNLCGR